MIVVMAVECELFEKFGSTAKVREVRQSDPGNRSNSTFLPQHSNTLTDLDLISYKALHRSY